MATFSSVGVDIVAALGAALEKGAHEIMAEADFLIPKDTLTALHSGRVLPVEDHGDALSITFGYGYGGEVNPKTGRTAAEYVVPLHEILEAHHEPPTQAKFLEQPVFGYAPVMEADLGMAIDAELRLGYGKSLR